MPLFAQAGEARQYLLICRDGIMAEQQSAHARHDAALFETAEMRAERFDAAEHPVVLNEENQIIPGFGYQLSGCCREDGVRQITADQRASGASRYERTPGGGSRMALRA